MNESKIIDEVKKGIENLDIYKINHCKWEDFKLFHHYRDLILDNDFLQSKKLQTAYFEIFKGFEILDKHLNGILKDILSEDEQTRINASIELRKVPNKVVNMVDKIWLKDPRTHSILAKALNDESEIVVKNIVNCFYGLYGRGTNYSYENPKILKEIQSKYQNADKDLKIDIVAFTFLYSTVKNNYIRDFDKKFLDNNHWKRVIEILDFKPKKSLYNRLDLFISSAGKEKVIPEKYKEVIKEKIWRDFQTARGKFVKWKCLFYYLQICFDDIKELQRIRENYTDEQLGISCQKFLNKQLK